MKHRPRQNRRDDAALVSQAVIPLEKPRTYRVLLHRDNQTPLNFLAHLLRKFFYMSGHAARHTASQVQHSGLGVCGVYPYDIAETKASEVIDYSQARGWSLSMSLERQ